MAVRTAVCIAVKVIFRGAVRGAIGVVVSGFLRMDV